ncbi:hypothetical protein [Actinomadura oligospora]|uniref:hypothetical protein n=1 Tax=Actinomadura oligospora TaxID=111804 RepID=UPI00047D33C6|nr:hypothetical protein [Actinomadura oligospora]
MHRSIARPSLVAALAVAALTLTVPAANAAQGVAAPSDVTGQRCVDGGGVIMGDDPLPLAWCIGGKYNGQRIIGH